MVGAFAVPPIVQPGTGFDGVVRLTDANGGSRTGVLLEDGLHVLAAAHSILGVAGTMTVNFNVFDQAGKGPVQLLF